MLNRKGLQMKDFAIILAADLPAAADVVSLVGQVGGIVDGVKIGVATLLEAGVDILKRISGSLEGKPLLVDLKIADIGFFSKKKWDGTNAKIISQLADSGATHVTVHGFPGPFSVAEAVDAARQCGLGVLLLPIMSHPTAQTFFSRPMERSDLVSAVSKENVHISIPPELPCRDVTDGILLLGEALQVAGYIGPASRPQELERYRRITSRRIWCPGFGRQDKLNRSLEEQFDQWARILGPLSAAIVGSTIFGSPDPLRAAEQVVEIRDRATCSP